jgi:hypothetical protein
MAHGPRVVDKRKSLIAVVVRQNVLVGSACGKDSTFDTLGVHHHADKFGFVLDEVFPVPCGQNKHGDEVVKEMVHEINIILTLDPGAPETETGPRLHRTGSPGGADTVSRL